MYTEKAMATTDAERISRIEGVLEATLPTLATQRDIEALRGDYKALRTLIVGGFATLTILAPAAVLALRLFLP